MKCEQKEERNRVKKLWRNVEKAISEEVEEGGRGEEEGEEEEKLKK